MATSPQLMQPSVRNKPQPDAKPAPARSMVVPCLLPALASGALLWMCYHPLSWGWLGWVGLVPLLCLVRSERRPRAVYFAAWAGGMLFFVPALQWMRVADAAMYATWILLAIYCALYFPLAVYFTRVLERRTRLPLAITLPAVWVGLEYIRAFFLTGFPWYFLAHSQHEFLTIIQVTDLGGTFAVSLLVVAVNALVFDVLYQFSEARALFQLRSPPPGSRTFGDDWPALGDAFIASWRRGVMIDAFAVGVLLIAAYLYGGWRLGQDMPRSGPVVALLQGNLDQRIRNAAHELPEDEREAARIRFQNFQDAVLKVGREYDPLCKLADRCEPHPDLFIWPETSYPHPWVESAPDLPADGDAVWRSTREWFRDRELENRQRFHDVFKSFSMPGRPFNTPQLLGIGTRILDKDRKERLYNSALLLNGHGNPDGRYDKMHRVPFGEYVPLRDWLPFMNWFSPYDFDYSIRSGEKFTRFAVDDYRFGVLVCFEDTDPSLARHYVDTEDDGPPVDFLVNISNDGWFNGTSEHEEHLAVSRFRAIECRRAMVRSVNMGISAVIDGSGRVLKATRANPPDEPLPIWYVGGEFGPQSMPHAEWASFKKVSGVLVAAVPLDKRFSVYAYAGDWLPGLCWLLIAIATVGTWVYTRFRPAS
jgi:apolipoprotein N-acyltransferase